jgi:hypothetical protein
MTSETPEGESTIEATYDRSPPRESSLTNRIHAWLSSNGLFVEAGLAIIAIAAGVVALPIVTFGTFTALEGETSILTAGLIVVVICAGVLLILATVLLVHGYAEFHHGRLLSIDGNHRVSIVYTGTRLVETFVAGAFLVGVIASLISVISIDTVPPLILFAVVAAGLMLPTVVLLHALGSVGLSLVD